MTTVEHTPGPGPQPATPPAGLPAPSSLPRLPGVVVPRPHLTRRLDRLAAVTVADSLPGFGARTLLAAWAHQQHAAGSHVVWLDGVPDEAPVASRDRLRSKLIRSGTLPEATGAELEHWIPALAERDRPVIVVIAGAPWPLTEHIADRLLTLTQRAHPVHLVVHGSADRALVENARRRGMDAQLITSADLRLQAQEEELFAAAWGSSLAPESVRQVGRRVGGWLLPLKLVLEATPAGSNAAALHVAHTFVLNEVLPGLLAADEREAVTRIAVPRTIDIPLAEALLADQGRGRAADLLAGLESRGLLWRQPGSSSRPRWRFPELVRSALVERCSEDSQNQRRARAITARILACRGDADLGELAEHTCAADDPALFADLWTEHGWALLGTDLSAFARAFGRRPREDDDTLTVPSGLAETARRIPPEADWLAHTEMLMRHYAAAGERFLADRQVVPSPSARLDLLTAAMVARRSEGRLADACRLADELDRAVRARRTAAARGLASQGAWGWLQAGVTHLHAGRYGDARRLTMAAHDAAPHTMIGRGAAALIGLMNAVTGDRAETERWLSLCDGDDDRASWGSRLAGLPGRLARAMQAMDRLEAARAREHLADSSLAGDASGLLPVAVAVHTRYALLFGEPVAMLTQLDRLALLAQRELATPDGLWRQVFDRSTADLLLALGEMDRARSLLGHNAADVPPWLVPAAARFHLIAGDARAAARVARAGAWQSTTHARDRMELLVVSAQALHSTGRTAEAAEDLRRAHALGRHVGSLEPYLLLGDQRAPLLAAAGLQLGSDALGALDRAKPVYPASATFVRLTPRELVVLTEMGQHETAAAVARALSVSVNTVKKQMVSIYAKLGVHDRGSALVRAHRLGLVPAPSVTHHPRR